jgi:protein TonB
MNQLKNFTLGHGMVVSLLLHACFVLPFLAWMTHTPRTYRPSSNRLNFEVIGVLSDRQMEAQHKRIFAPRTSAPPAPKNETQETKPETAPKEIAHFKTQPLQSESLADTLDAVRLPQASMEQFNVSHASGTAARAGGNVEQQPQAIAVHNDINDRIAAYVAQLSRRLQANVVYPEEAKRKKIKGVSLISFVIMDSGEIRPNTLAVKKSSGNATLDASALRVAANSAPFQKPPRELSVTIAIAFEVD